MAKEAPIVDDSESIRNLVSLCLTSLDLAFDGTPGGRSWPGNPEKNNTILS